MTPDQILAELDEVSAAYNTDSNSKIALQLDLRGLLWEVIWDMLDSLGRYADWRFEDPTPAAVVAQCKAMLTDYVVNIYGDD